MNQATKKMNCVAKEPAITHRELSEEEFVERFPLVENHLDPDATWAWGDGRGCLFETYGAEFEFVRSRDPRCVWTLVDGDEGETMVVSGLTLVNRLGYLVSSIPVPAGEEYRVRLDEASPDPDEQATPGDRADASRFPLGHVVGTPGALEALTPGEMLGALGRHARGDWGLVGAEDREENELSLAHGFRLFSVYESTDGTRFWVITEADRSATTVLLPDEY